MTTISAGAAAGLLVALMVMATDDGFGAEQAVDQATDVTRPGGIRGFDPQPDPPGATRGFNPQPDPPRVLGDSSVRPVGHSS